MPITDSKRAGYVWQSIISDGIAYRWYWPKFLLSLMTQLLPDEIVYMVTQWVLIAD